MKQTIYLNQFIDAFNDAFKNYNRRNNFSYEGLKAIYEYLEEIDENYELDVIAICCEFTEYENVKEYLTNYSTDIDKEDYIDEDTQEFDEEGFNKAVLEEISEKTTLLTTDTDKFVIVAY